MRDTEQWREQLFFSPTPIVPRPDSLSYGNTAHFNQGHQSQDRNNPHLPLPSHVLFPGMVLISWGWSGPTNIRNWCQEWKLNQFSVVLPSKPHHKDTKLCREQLSWGQPFQPGFLQLPGGCPGPSYCVFLIPTARVGVGTICTKAAIPRNAAVPELGHGGNKGANPAAAQNPAVECVCSPGNSCSWQTKILQKDLCTIKWPGIHRWAVGIGWGQCGWSLLHVLCTELVSAFPTGTCLSQRIEKMVSG